MLTYEERRAHADKYTEYIKTLRERDAAPNELPVIKTKGRERKYVVCPRCRHISNDTDSFCRYCGQRLRRAEYGKTKN